MANLLFLACVPHHLLMHASILQFLGKFVAKIFVQVHQGGSNALWDMLGQLQVQGKGRKRASNSALEAEVHEASGEACGTVNA